MNSQDKEAMEWEFEFAKRMSPEGNENAGRIVEMKNGTIGRIYNKHELVNGKLQVYTEKGRFLCDPATTKLIGFVD